MTTINITMTNHKGTGLHGVSYRSLNAEIVHGGHIDKVSTVAATNPVDFIEQALLKVTDIAIGSDFTPQHVTINLLGEIVLSANLQTNLADKFTCDPLINSITFA